MHSLLQKLYIFYRRHLPISQRWYWSREWQRGEREADRDIREGQFVSMDADEFAEWLRESRKW
jgi:hypothetical protein